VTEAGGFAQLTGAAGDDGGVGEAASSDAAD
jgi:hypothetical protein